MWRVVLVVVVASCGRLHFDSTGKLDDGGGAGDTTGDTVAIDAALPSGLVVWFPMGEPMAHDVVGGGVGTCVAPACPAITTGYSGNALQFDGIDDCLVIADYAALHQAVLTIAFRARTSGAQDTACFCKRVDIAGNPGNSWELGVGPTNDLELTTNHGATSNEQIVSPAGDVVIGDWQHFAFTWDGATKHLYVDGIERATGSSSMPLSYDAHAAYIGCDDNGSLTRFFSGALDEIQIYDRPLTAPEIHALAM